MKATLDVDTREFQAAALELFRTSNRSCVDFINGQTLRVVIEALRQTDAAKAERIAWVLGQTGNKLKSVVSSKGKNKGKTMLRRGDAIVRENSFAERILATRFRLTGEWGVTGNTMEERVRNYIAKAVRSAAFIKSGWIPARTAFFAVVKKRPPGTAVRAEGSRQYGKPKGSAKPAAFALTSKITAEAINTALKGNMPNVPSPGGNPMPVAERGLRKSLAVVAKDMIETLAKRLGTDTQKYNARSA